MDSLSPLAIAYGLSFLLGLGLVLRPLAILFALLLKPTLLATILLVAAGVFAVVPAAAPETLPALLGVGLAATAGGAFGLRLRRLTRGGF